MKTEGIKTKVYAGVVTVLLLTAVVGTGVLYDRQGGLKAGLDKEKLASEKLLSEKLLLDKEIARLNKELSSLNEKNTQLGNQLEVSTSKAAEQANILGKLQKENSNLKGLAKEVGALKVLRDQLQTEVLAIKEANYALMQANEQMGQAITLLEAENKALKDKLKTAAVLKAGNFRIDVLRKNNQKQTVKARQTKVVAVSFDLLETSMASMGKSKVYVVLTAPNGKPVVGDRVETKTVYPEGVKTEITPSATQEADLGKGPQRLSITFEPADNLEEGIYQVALYTDDMYLGNSQFKLMK